MELVKTFRSYTCANVSATAATLARGWCPTARNLPLVKRILVHVEVCIGVFFFARLDKVHALC